jgi:CelD/BcsL family acetyltransferase involved in cellulose biosynthesis
VRDGVGAPVFDGVTVRWIAASDRASAGREWQALEARLAVRGLACSWDWTRTWLRHYGDLVPHRFVVAEVEGTTCGIALVTSGVGRRRGPFPIRTIHIGTAGEPIGEGVYVEYNRVLVDPGIRDSFAAAVIGELRRERNWDELVLDGFAPEDARPFLQATTRLQASTAPSPTANLHAAHAAEGDVLRTLRSSTRRKVRRGLRGLGAVETEWAEAPDHACDILEELIVLHQQRWQGAGQPGAFASPRFAGFHRELVPLLLPRGAVLLFRVRAAGATVGCLYSFVEDGRVLFYQSGLAPQPGSEIRPGFVAHALCMQACFDRGLREYDFLAGDARYKDELSTGNRELVWATWHRRTPRGRLIDGAAKVKGWAAAMRRERAADPG